MQTRKYLLILKIIWIALISICFYSKTFAQTDLATKFYYYSSLVEERYNEPVGSPKHLEPYLRWMDIKAKDRDEINKLLEEANRRSHLNPSDEQLKKWTQEYFLLHKKAQESGNSTAEGGAIMLLGIENHDNFMSALQNIQHFGRPLFLKAKESKFSTNMIRGKAKCMLNFVIGDIECSVSGGGLYRDCDIEFGYIGEDGYHRIPDRDFDVLCEPRSEFVTYSQGDPQQKSDWAFGWMYYVREEAQWWEFQGEFADAEDLMNQYNEDTLCKNPPNVFNKGHKFYVDLAEKYKFDECIRYNKGFYGKVYGKVEILQEGKKLDAPFAIVTIKDKSQTWNATADKNGNYEIPNVILHKECGPFDISATFEGERVDEKYEGILVKPDTTARLKKNLLIKSFKHFSWSGSLMISVTEDYGCSQHEKTEHGIIKELNESMKKNRSITMSIWSGEFTVPPLGVSTVFSDDFGGMGVASTNYNEDSRMRWEHTKGACPGTIIFRTNTSEGSAGCNLDQNNLVISIARNMSVVKNIADKMSNANPNDLANMQKELESMMTQADEADSELDVVVQINLMCMGTVINEEKYDKESTCQDNDEPRINIGSVEVPLIGPMAFNLKGSYTKGKRGDDIISATFSKKYTKPTGKGKGEFEENCPEIEVIENCTLYLARKPDK